MRFFHDMRRGYTDRDIERVRGWVVKREHLGGNVIYLTPKEMKVFHDFAAEWGASGDDVRLYQN